MTTTEELRLLSERASWAVLARYFGHPFYERHVGDDAIGAMVHVMHEAGPSLVFRLIPPELEPV
jgi:hypothetical protein